MRQSADADLPEIARSANADLAKWLGMLHEAMRATGWTVDALAAEWKVNRSYVWRLVAGEKPWSVERQLALPDDLEAELERLRAKSFGLVVVDPVDEATAREHLVSGLMGLLAPRLPARSGKPVKVDLPAATIRKTEVG